ncbi:hypothetical protein L484_026346 [Morus notabilis]|uniref:Uncharacterized protein n=1 Tax=Morus notabilis TaxID=981085 RepID=W9QY66_9ROSA|nr:hypothetical protein L484_026346 [Morus notabilis]
MGPTKLILVVPLKSIFHLPDAEALKLNPALRSLNRTSETPDLQQILDSTEGPPQTADPGDPSPFTIAPTKPSGAPSKPSLTRRSTTKTRRTSSSFTASVRLCGKLNGAINEILVIPKITRSLHRPRAHFSSAHPPETLSLLTDPTSASLASASQPPLELSRLTLPQPLSASTFALSAKALSLRLFFFSLSDSLSPFISFDCRRRSPQNLCSSLAETGGSASRGHCAMVVSPRYLNGTAADIKCASVVDTESRIKVPCFRGEEEVAFFHEYREGVDWVFVNHTAYHK